MCEFPPDHLRPVGSIMLVDGGLDSSDKVKKILT